MKKIIIKSYRSDGTFISNITDANFEEFVKEINGGYGECVLTFARAFDDTNEDIELNNKIEILVCDKDTLGLSTTNGEVGGAKLIYKGYISNVNRVSEGSEKEKIVITVLGYYTKLSQDIFKNGTTTTISYTANFFSTMIKNILDRYVAETTNPQITYREEDIETTPTAGNYTFEMMTYREAIDKVISLTPANWFWYVDANGFFYLKEKPSTPTHQFIFGKHFSSIEANISIEGIINSILIWNGKDGVDAIYKFHEDIVSVAKYGRRVQKIVNYGADVEETLDYIADKIIAENKDPEIILTCQIVDNNLNNKGYDIESIEPGDTCVFTGFSGSMEELLRDNMLITSVKYTPEKVEIIVKVKDSGLMGWQKIINQKVSDGQNRGTPTDYTI